MSTQNPVLKLFRAAGAYTVANAFNALVPFLLLPLITAAVTADDYGVYGVYISAVNMLVPFAALTIERSTSRAFVDPKIDIARYVTSAIVLISMTTTIVLLLVLLTRRPVGEFIGFPAMWLPVAVLGGFFRTHLTVLLAMLQMKNWPLAFGAMRISESGITGGLTLALVMVWGLGWRGLLLGHVVSLALFYPIALTFLRKLKLLGWPPKRAYAHDAFRFGVPLIPHIIATVFIGMSDRVMLAKMVDFADAGVYTTAFQVGLAIFLVITSVDKAFMPWLFAQLADEANAKKRTIVVGTYLYFAFLLCLVGVSYLLGPPFVAVYLGDDFQRAGELLPWLVLAFAFHGMQVTMVNYVYFSKRTGLLSIASVAAAITNVSLNLILIPRYGMYGAAWSSSAGFFLAFLISWFFGARLVKMPWFSFWRAPKA